MPARIIKQEIVFNQRLFLWHLKVLAECQGVPPPHAINQSLMRAWYGVACFTPTPEVIRMKKQSALLLSFLMLLAPAAAHADVNLGVLANRGELKAQEEWTELANKLTAEVGTPVKLVPLTMDKTQTSFENKSIDLLLANPVVSALISEKYKGQLVATVNTDKGYEFGGVIIANKATNITKSEDLKGKKVMSYAKDSAGAYIFQVYHLKQKGIDVNKDLGSFVEAKKQDDIPMAVKSGMFDAGFVRTGVLESMEKKGTLKVDDFLIVDKVEGGKEVRSTPLYPEWAVIARPDADAAMVSKVKTALLGVKAEDQAAVKANIKGFVEPRDLAPLTVVLKELKVPPFDK